MGAEARRLIEASAVHLPSLQADKQAWRETEGFWVRDQGLCPHSRQLGRQWLQVQWVCISAEEPRPGDRVLERPRAPALRVLARHKHLPCLGTES